MRFVTYLVGRKRCNPEVEVVEVTKICDTWSVATPGVSSDHGVGVVVFLF